MPNPKETRILLTGITGYIGAHMAILLLQEGYQVRGTLRSLKRAPVITNVISLHTDGIERLELAEADLTQESHWPAAMEGIDYVLHIASPVPLKEPKDERSVIGPAVNGTLNVLKAAQAAGVKRVVITSSISAAGYGHTPWPNRPFTEEDWSVSENRKDSSAYVRSKTMAERAAWAFMEEHGKGMELCTILPGMVLGPVLEEDYGTTPGIIKRLLDGSLPALPRMGMGVVHVADVTDIHLKALFHPAAAGQRFLATGPFMWFHEMAEVLREHLEGHRIPRIIMPTALVKLYALVDGDTRGVLHELNRKRDFSITKAQELLQWHPRSGAEAVLATAKSLIEQGLV